MDWPVSVGERDRVVAPASVDDILPIRARLSFGPFNVDEQIVSIVPVEIVGEGRADQVFDTDQSQRADAADGAVAAIVHQVDGHADISSKIRRIDPAAAIKDVPARAKLDEVVIAGSPAQLVVGVVAPQDIIARPAPYVLEIQDRIRPDRGPGRAPVGAVEVELDIHTLGIGEIDQGIFACATIEDVIAVAGTLRPFCGSGRTFSRRAPDAECDINDAVVTATRVNVTPARVDEGLVAVRIRTGLFAAFTSRLQGSRILLSRLDDQALELQTVVRHRQSQDVEPDLGISSGRDLSGESKAILRRPALDAFRPKFPPVLLRVFDRHLEALRRRIAQQQDFCGGLGETLDARTGAQLLVKTAPATEMIHNLAVDGDRQEANGQAQGDGLDNPLGIVWIGRRGLGPGFRCQQTRIQIEAEVHHRGELKIRLGQGDGPVV